MATISNTTRARNSKSAAFKATVVDAPVKEETTSAFDMNSLFDSFKLPSGKRILVSFIAAALAGGCVGYVGGNLIAYLVVGAVMLTGSAFIAFLLMVLGYALMLLAAVVVGGKVQMFILSGDIDRTYNKAKSAVTGWLGGARAKAATFTARVAS